MPRYAANTDVSAAKSRAEIETTLSRYGADQFMYGWAEGRAVIGFRMEGRFVRFEMPMPDANDEAFTLTPTGRDRSQKAQEDAYDQAVRQRWRALLLVIKAKLEAVEAEITTFEEEFLAHIVMPDGSTVGATAVPAIAEAYRTGKFPQLLPHN